MLLALGGVAVEAQSSPLRVPPPIGTAVRAEFGTDGQTRVVKGLLVSGTELGLVVRPGSGPPDTIPASTIVRLDVSRGRSHAIGALKGLGFGAAGGALVFGIVGALGYSDASGPCDSPGCADSASGAFHHQRDRRRHRRRAHRYATRPGDRIPALAKGLVSVRGRPPQRRRTSVVPLPSGTT